MPDREFHTSIDEYLSGHKRLARVEERFLANKRLMAEEKIKLLAGELPRIFPMHKIYLFGSLVDGRFHSLSDIDIAVEGLDDQNYLKAYTIAERIARPFRVDLVLLEEAESSLQKKVKERGVVIYEQG